MSWFPIDHINMFKYSDQLRLSRQIRVRTATYTLLKRTANFYSSVNQVFACRVEYCVLSSINKRIPVKPVAQFLCAVEVYTEISGNYGYGLNNITE